jgi:hypothetical protein
LVCGRGFLKADRLLRTSFFISLWKAVNLLTYINTAYKMNESGSLDRKKIFLILFTICCCLLVFLRSPISQDGAYHHFADQREFFQVPNWWNVVTNFPFLIVGVFGLMFFVKNKHRLSNKLAYLILFLGVIGIGFGSAWYHYNPNNTTLVWDRIPMTITFMSYFSIIVGQYVDKKFGEWTLIPMLLIGVFSVIYWHYTENMGHGDLRLYALVQFYPMLVIPLILFLFPASTRIRMEIVAVILVYTIAKVMEHWDDAIFQFHQLISGHSLKHLVACYAVFLILRTLKVEQRVSSVNTTNSK